MHINWKSLNTNLVVFGLAIFCGLSIGISNAVVVGNERDLDSDSETTKFENQYFSAPEMLMVGDVPLNSLAKKKYPSPAMYDVDKDGELELIVGDIFGAINVYENSSEKGDPVWEKHTPLKLADGKVVKVSNW